MNKWDVLVGVVIASVVLIIASALCIGTVMVTQSNDHRKEEIIKTCVSSGQNFAICANLVNK